MLSLTLRNTVLQFIIEEISIEELEDYYVPKLSFFLRDPTSDDADLIAAIELSLTDFNSGLIDKAAIKATLLKFIQEHKNLLVEDFQNKITVVTGTSNVTATPLNLWFSRQVEVTNLSAQ